MKYGKIVAIGLAIAALVLGSHVFGTYTVEKELPPYPSVLEQAFSALDVYVGELSGRGEVTAFGGGGSGVSVNESGTYDGYTFYTADDAPEAHLIDMQGNVEHTWRLKFREAFPKASHLGAGDARTGVIWRSARIFPNGDVLAVMALIGATPYGYGLVKMDRDSNVIWSYPQHVNHLAEVGEQGNVYALFHEWRNVEENPVPNQPQLSRGTEKVLEDFIAILGPDGEEKQTFSLLEALAESPFHPLHEMFRSREHQMVFTEAEWDPLHPNNIEVVTPSLAKKAPELEVDQVMVSFRTIDALVVFDRETEEAVWVTRGFWKRQHDPDILEDGNLLVFDNRGNRTPGKASRIVEYDPASGALRTIYSGTEEQPFYTEGRGSQHPLPNGNVLVTESNQGRIFEVTNEGELVWQFRAGSGKRRPIVHSAMRVSEEWLEFDPSK